MLTKTDIEKFYQDLGCLKLRFPVAALAKATGFSKGNVSEYIRKLKDPSEAFIKKFYAAFPEAAQEFSDTRAEEAMSFYNTDKLTNQTVFNLSESGRQHATADRARAEAELLREQNTKRMIDLITTENAAAENHVAFDAIAGDLLELLIDLGTGKRWSSKQEAAAAVRNKLYGGLKKKKADGIQKH